jgi:hypothetical protein
MGKIDLAQEKVSRSVLHNSATVTGRDLRRWLAHIRAGRDLRRLREEVSRAC